MRTGISPFGGAPIVRLGPKASYTGPVLSLPFEALYEEVLREGVERKNATGTIYRDSGGRVRREYRIVQEGGRERMELVVITDPAARTIIALNVDTRTATTSSLFGPPARGSIRVGWAFEGRRLPESGQERIVEGLLCTKVRPAGSELGTASKATEMGEIWISEGLKYSLLERVTDADHEYSWRLYNIRRREPPESLFGVPRGYTLVASG